MTTPSAGVKRAEQDTPGTRLAAYVNAVVARAPKLSSEQADRISALLRGGTR